MQRYFIYLAYDGTAYHGWQIQPNGTSIQERLMQALATLLRQEVEVTGAGRTDAGVHARLMVAHFDSPAPLDTTLMTDKLNRLLPPDIAVYRLRPVRNDAHARFDATSRTYQYHITTAKNPFARQYSYRLFRTPDIGRMNEAAATLPLYTDFTSFSKLHTDVKTNNCRISHAAGRRPPTTNGGYSPYAPTASCATWCGPSSARCSKWGADAWTPRAFRCVIEQRDRCQAGTSVPGNALFLTDITYPESLFLDRPDDSAP